MRSCIFLLLLALALPARATVFSSLHGVVHDPAHRPIAGAHVALEATGSTFTLDAVTSTDGTFNLPQVPLGAYRISVSATGFAVSAQSIALSSGAAPALHIQLEVASTAQSVEVRSAVASVVASSPTPTVLVTRAQIDETPGASRTLGMTMITDYVPGAYMTHDMLHIRGGHQTSWLIDGVSLPNTKIASNVGPQIDPKDIDSLEIQRGSYSASLGDRSYGVFNVLPRNGFERDREAELRLSGGNFDSGETQISFGDHSARTAWYASATGSRSDYGLAPPVTTLRHDATNSASGFLSLIRNQTARDQLRLDAQFRRDFFQIPYDPDPSDWEQSADYYNSYGLRDTQTEQDGFIVANWVRTLSPRALFEAAPFYHFNQSNYDAPASDTPVATTWHQTSHYAGLQTDARFTAGAHNFSGGLYSFYQAERDLYGLVINDQSYAENSIPSTASSTSAGLVEFHVADHWQVMRLLTLDGGLRVSTFRAGYNENAVYPRLGATFVIPRLRWVLRGFYGRYFQPAPVETVSSAFLSYVTAQPGQNTFVPLRSERDEEHQFGVAIPFRGWLLDVDTFRTRINNFLDHANVGESNIYFPINVDGALVRAWELSLRSPELARLGRFHLVYSNQIAEQRGAVTGGFACSDATNDACAGGSGYEPVDHDQRHTLNTGFTAALPAQTWFAADAYYGSGFVNGLAGSGSGPYQGDYLPAHTTFDLSAGRSFGERWRLSASALNVTNHRVLLDNSVTIGGFHWNDPRMISGELRYRFHF